VAIQTYDYLTRLAPLPVAVIQSTGDDYLPADKARQLFGPDTPTHRFIAVDARDHAFGGARDELYRQMARSLAWITSTTGREHCP
jgi:hypothetical protein